MADNAAEGPPHKLPLRIAKIVDKLAKAGRSAGIEKPLLFWDIGQVASELRKNGGDITVAELRQHAGLSERQMRYCTDVAEAFTRDRLEDLLKQALGWSTIRELASEGLEDDKDALIERFEKECSEDPKADPKAARKAGRKANTRLRNELIAERNRRMRKSEKEGKRQGTIRRVAKSLTSQSTKLQSALAEARRDFKSGSAAATTGVGDSLESDSAEALRTLDEALRRLLLEVGEFLLQSAALTGEDVPPGTKD